MKDSPGGHFKTIFLRTWQGQNGKENE